MLPPFWEVSNLALGCRGCNLYKSDQTSARDELLGGEEVRLFHPRSDHWEDHFVINVDLSVAGKTVGRTGHGGSIADELTEADCRSAAMEFVEPISVIQARMTASAVCFERFHNAPKICGHAMSSVESSLRNTLNSIDEWNLNHF